ncbi:MAG: hypothetical protein U0941_11340 [Planctomycetaceae bacterium]
MNTILVTGDFLVDHHIYEGRRHYFGDQKSPGVCVKEELGGGALIHRLLKEMQASAGSAWESVLAVDEELAVNKLRSCDSHAAGCCEQPFSAYAFWRPFPTHGKSKQSCWRVAEAMGFGGGPADAGQWPWDRAKDLPTCPNVLVISDGGMGFRSRMNVAHWGVPVHDQRLLELFRESNSGESLDAAASITAEEPRWIVLKMSAPVGEGDLWRELSQFHSERLVVIVSATELRRADLRLGPALSWEQTLEELHAALNTNPGMQSLTKCRHLIIPFDTEGALWLSNENGSRKATFLFDPEHVEGERRQDMEGDVYGHLSCLAATVAAEVGSLPANPNLESAIRRGLAAMRHLRESGHGNATERGSGFPAKSLAAVVAKGDSSTPLQVRSFDCDVASCPIRPDWSLLALHESPAAGASGVPLHGIARRVLIQGPRVLRAPTLKVGDFFTADRGEIEALRSLRQLVDRYVDDRKADKPLSIGVFGPPGAGKSFAVKELAKALLGDQLGWLEFNLSQFNGPADLIGALHQVRDKILEGKLPVAFFDEFDSQNFIWLKFLLAPMQDGRFQEGQISHPVGQCLFVFAGGTSHTFEAFEAKGEGTGTPGHEAADHFVLSKGPDFASRLDGKFNVVGPNPRTTPGASSTDIFFPVRRALFIRSRLRCSETERLDIHPGLATALLELPKFKHGSRSLTKLLEPFRVLRRNQPNARLGLSSLLPQDQLALHVELQKFDALTRRDEETANQLGVDKLACAVHAFYRTKGGEEGWLKKHHDRDFADLSPFDQASNRAAARRIPAILALAGLKLAPGHATANERSEMAALLSFHEDILGEAEHDGWMAWHFANGWSHSESRDDARQLNELLIPYSELPEIVKAKDKDAIKHYPDIAELAGLKIVSGV